MTDEPRSADERVWVDDRMVAHMLDYWRACKIRLVETEHKQAERDMAAAFVAVIEEVQWRRSDRNITTETVTRAEAQSWVDHAVSRQQAQYRTLFAEYGRVIAERNKYQKALQKICQLGRSPVAEEALGSCEKCVGRGRLNDADIGDTYFNECQCPDCKGTGLKQSSDDVGGKP